MPRRNSLLDPGFRLNKRRENFGKCNPRFYNGIPDPQIHSVVRKPQSSLRTYLFELGRPRPVDRQGRRRWRLAGHHVALKPVETAPERQAQSLPPIVRRLCTFKPKARVLCEQAERITTPAIAPITAFRRTPRSLDQTRKPPYWATGTIAKKAGATTSAKNRRPDRRLSDAFSISTVAFSQSPAPKTSPCRSHPPLPQSPAANGRHPNRSTPVPQR